MDVAGDNTAPLNRKRVAELIDLARAEIKIVKSHLAGASGGDYQTDLASLTCADAQLVELGEELKIDGFQRPGLNSFFPDVYCSPQDAISDTKILICIHKAARKQSKDTVTIEEIRAASEGVSRVKRSDFYLLAELKLVSAPFEQKNALAFPVTITANGKAIAETLVRMFSEYPP